MSPPQLSTISHPGGLSHLSGLLHGLDGLLLGSDGLLLHGVGGLLGGGLLLLLDSVVLMLKPLDGRALDQTNGVDQTLADKLLLSP